MAVKDSIFGSEPEAKGFRSIEHTWGRNYAVYPQIPISEILDADPEFQEKEKDFFYKTSLDYVLCSKEGRPMVAIDFDGLRKGFDRDGEYVQGKGPPDRNRKWKFDFKLRLAQKYGFPYHIVSSQEFRQDGGRIKLTVVDGIIGSSIAKQCFLKRAPSFLEEHAEEIERQPDSCKSEFIQDLLMVLELDCDVEHSKIVRKTFELMDEIRSIEGDFPVSTEYRLFEEPECPSVELEPWRDMEAFRRRLEAFQRIEVWGCTVTLGDTPVGDVSATVKMRNVAHSITLVNEIGELVAWSRLLRRLRKNRDPREFAQAHSGRPSVS